MSEITKENGKIKAQVRRTNYGDEFLTMRNGYQWCGQDVTPELAKLSIEVLTEYLNGALDKPAP